jgi:PadR family transcriptional regulator, regulatory protein PadR
VVEDKSGRALPQSKETPFEARIGNMRTLSKTPVDIHRAAMYSAPMLAKELVAASTEPMILSLLAKGESYGYALIQEVKRLSGDKIEWTDGMLYPVLHRMEQNGWIKSRWVEVETGRKRKYYFLKKDGQKALKQKQEQWSMVASVLGALWTDGALTAGKA